MCSKKLTCPVKPEALSLSQEKPSWVFYHGASELETNPSTSTCYGLRGFSSGISHFTEAPMPLEFVWFEAFSSNTASSQKRFLWDSEERNFMSQIRHFIDFWEIFEIMRKVVVSSVLNNLVSCFAISYSAGSWWLLLKLVLIWRVWWSVIHIKGLSSRRWERQ